MTFWSSAAETPPFAPPLLRGRGWRERARGRMRSARDFAAATAGTPAICAAQTRPIRWKNSMPTSRGVTGGEAGGMDAKLAAIAIHESAGCREWMRGRGVRFQPSLGGTLHLGRTSAFFLGGGKALMNSWTTRRRKSRGIRVLYDAEVVGLPNPRRELRERGNPHRRRNTSHPGTRGGRGRRRLRSES